MATITEIPLRSDLPWFAETVELAGVQYRLEFAWNTRDARWYFSILAADGTQLVMGLPIVVDFPILNRFTDDRLPDGDLWVWDVSGDGIEPDQYDLGDRVKMFLIEED